MIMRKQELLKVLAWVGVAWIGTAGVNAKAGQGPIPGSRFLSARAAAMGDAILPLGEDGATALFVNPIATQRAKKFQAEPLNLSLQTDTGFVSGLGIDSYKVYSLSSNLANIQANPNVVQGAGFAIAPSIVYNGIAVGFLAQSRQYASVDSANQVTYRSSYLLVPAAAYSVRLANGVIRFGYGLQWVNKAEGEVTVASASATGYNNSIASGGGLSHTAAFAFTLPIAYLPAFNLVARNAFSTNYSMPSILPVANGSTGSPSTEYTTYDASVSLSPKLGGGVNAQLVGVYKDASNRSDVPVMGRIALGAELGVKDFLFLRGGYGSGYPSFGLALRLKTGELGVAWYSEELTNQYRGKQDVRYMMQFQARSF